jgi:hypothetical protein
VNNGKNLLLIDWSENGVYNRLSTKGVGQSKSCVECVVLIFAIERGEKVTTKSYCAYSGSRRDTLRTLTGEICNIKFFLTTSSKAPVCTLIECWVNSLNYCNFPNTRREILCLNSNLQVLRRGVHNYHNVDDHNKP